MLALWLFIKNTLGVIFPQQYNIKSNVAIRLYQKKKKKICLCFTSHVWKPVRVVVKVGNDNSSYTCDSRTICPMFIINATILCTLKTFWTPIRNVNELTIFFPHLFFYTLFFSFFLTITMSQ